MGGIKIKKVTPKEFKKALAKGVTKFTGFNPDKIHSAKDFGKQLASGVYTVSGAKQVVTSGKALSKCKPNDSKCIAANLGGIAAVGVGKIPGVGFVAGMATSQALQQAQAKANKDIEKKKEVDRKLEIANRNLAAATTPEEKQKAADEVANLIRQDKKLEKKIQKEEKKVEIEKKKAEAVQAKVLQQVKSLPPDQQEQVFQESQGVIAGKPPDPETVAAAEAAATSELVVQQQNEQSKALEYISGQLEEKKIMGLSQSKFFMYAGGLAFVFLLLLIILRR